MLVSAAVLLLTAQPALQQEERRTSLTGNIKMLKDFPSKILGNKRDIVIYLPPEYDASNRRYSVLYMGDGQNLFDGMTSYIPNKEWRIDETCEELIKAKKIEPIIVVGVNNAGADRANEYLPTAMVDRPGGTVNGGKASDFARFLVNELKPAIDKQFRTRRDAASTGLGGSSFGGIMALYIGLTRPEVFGKLAVVSPSVWWDNRVILKMVEMLPEKTHSKIWVNIGTAEGPGAEPATVLLRDALVKKGWVLGKDLHYMADPGAIHQEGAWAGRMPAILQFLYPPKL